MDHSDGCDESWDEDECYSDGWDEASDASGSAPTGCRTRVDLSSPLHYTLALRVLADASVHVQLMAIPTLIFHHVDSDEETFDCRFCSFPAGTEEDRTLHQGRCLSLLVKAHRLKFDPGRRAGQRRRRSKASRTAPAQRPVEDPPSPGSSQRWDADAVLYPLGSPHFYPRMTDPQTTTCGAATPTLPNPPSPTPARRPNRPDYCAAQASLDGTSTTRPARATPLRSTASYSTSLTRPRKPTVRSQVVSRQVGEVPNPPPIPTINSQKVDLGADIDQGCL